MMRAKRAAPSKSPRFTAVQQKWGKPAPAPKATTISSTPATQGTLSHIGSSAKSAFRLDIARTYLLQAPRYRILVTLLVTLLIIGAEVWAMATYLNGREPVKKGVYGVEEKQGWINLAAFVVGMLGFLGVSVLVAQAVMRVWAKWDRVVHRGLREQQEAERRAEIEMGLLDYPRG